jgi:sulfate adenylyltransferase subunit 1
MSTLLRLATAGSVDDGKSTLVGRLLHDTKSILADQLESVERVSKQRGLEGADLALLTDGLRAEREQGITIDVAYRYFATPKRSFVLADCPGHVQYTRNTVTGSSTADVIVLLVDARHGVLEQTRRHLAVASLLRVPHVVVAVNKIDLVDFDEDTFRTVEAEVLSVVRNVGIESVSVIPVSALHGDNIVDRSVQTPWYTGPGLLELLEELPAGENPEGSPFRLPVQYVLRPQAAAMDPKYVEYRGYAGQIAAGIVRPGDDVTVLPSGRRTTVTGIDTADGELTEGFAGQSVSIRLADDIDLSRGDMIVASDTAPTPTREVEALVCWLAERPLRVGEKVLLKHTTRTVRAVVKELDSRLDLDSLAGVSASELELNDIGRVHLRLADEISAETYAESRSTGSFLLIDAQSGHTLAAGMIRNTVPEDLSSVDWVI